MSDSTEETEGPKPFSEFLHEHNRGAGHQRASESLQALVAAVLDTGKKGSVTVTVSVEPMKGNPDAMLTTIDVKEKLPTNPLRGAVFYADDDGNLSRTDPGQLQLDVKDGPEAPTVRDAPAAPAVRSV